MCFYLEQLNDPQREAVKYLDGPELVIAGAGSGKTRVLTYKIVHLLAKGYEPWRIMALTFTNKAAAEMRERITALSGEATSRRLWMGTFHSIFARILRLNAERIGFKPNYTIYDSADSKSLIKTIIRDMNLDEKVYKASTVAAVISNAKNALISPEMYSRDIDMQRSDQASHRSRMADIYAAYCNRCRVAGAMDFDDLLYHTNILLRDNPDIRHHYQEYFQYILVDEYQDTNFAQHAIVTQLCGEEQHLCVVGDDAQSIYSFRGANIRNILNLKRYFPGLRMFKLEQNYRSTENIINAAGTLISRNTEQIPKNVFSKNGAGQRVEVVKSYSDYEESFLVANRITALKRSGSAGYNDFAILYRTNAQSRLLEESLRKRNIPYRIYGGLSFYSRKEVKDAIAYFRLAINPDDDEALKRVINVPARGIGETTLKKIVSAAMESRVSIWTVLQSPTLFDVKINSGTSRKLQVFSDLIRPLCKMVADGAPADKVARTTFAATGLLGQYRSDRTPENIAKAENLEEILNETSQFVAERHEQGLDDQAGMVDFMAELSLKTDSEIPDEDGSDEKVTLMTIHAAKGLEYENVFVVGVEEDLLPSAMSQNTAAEIEEERRLLYVAITRAKRFCMLSYASSRYRNGMTVTTRPSRFLGDMNPEYLDFVSGADITGPSASAWQVRGGAGTFPAATATRPSQHYQETFRPSVREKHAPAPDASETTTHNASEISSGMTIIHPHFGHGVITATDFSNPSGERITVNFGQGDLKTLLLKFARFKIEK